MQIASSDSNRNRNDVRRLTCIHSSEFIRAFGVKSIWIHSSAFMRPIRGKMYLDSFQKKQNLNGRKIVKKIELFRLVFVTLCKRC